MAKSKGIRTKSSQRVHKFPQAKGKIVAEVELSLSPDYNLIEVVFLDSAVISVVVCNHEPKSAWD